MRKISGGKNLKKILVLTIVFVFILSLVPINAGPAYEILKAKNSYTVKVVKWTLPEFLFMPIIQNAIGQMEEKGALKARFKNEFIDLIITRCEFVYSRISFKQAARSNTFLLALRLVMVTSRLRDNEFMDIKGLFVQDLASKGLTRTDIKNVFDYVKGIRDLFKELKIIKG